jgi:hypothetical protein
MRPTTRRNVRILAATGTSVLAVSVAVALIAAAARNPAEGGRVRWTHDIEAAREAARSSGRPILVLEGVGKDCDACKTFARQALDHPIVVDAAAESFIAVAPAGRWGGAKAAAAPAADEIRGAAHPAHPAHQAHQPAVRFVDAAGQDLAEALPVETGSAELLVRRMHDALAEAGRPVPRWLALVADEYDPPGGRRTAAFAVSCYWKGEKELGRLDGVVATRTGMVGRDEVVEVEFDPAVLDPATLTGKAKAMSCFRKVVAAGASADEAPEPADILDTSGNQQQYHLWLRKPWHFVPLTGLQATKVNAALLYRTDPAAYLSPSQVAIQQRLQALYAKNWRALDDLEGAVRVDRAPAELGDYWRRIEREVGGLE